MKKFRLICVANLGRKSRTKESERERGREGVSERELFVTMPAWPRVDNMKTPYSCVNFDGCCLMKIWSDLPVSLFLPSLPLLLSHSRTHFRCFLRSAELSVCVFGINFWQSSYFRQPVGGHALSIPLPLTHFHLDSLSLSLSLLTCGSPKCRLHINLFSLLMFRPLWQSCLDNWSNLMKRARRALFEHYIW